MYERKYRRFALVTDRWWWWTPHSATHFTPPHNSITAYTTIYTNVMIVINFPGRLISATDCCFCCPAIVIVVGLSRGMSSNCFVALKNGWGYVPGPNLYVLLSLCGAMPRGGIWPGGWKYYYTTTCKILRVLTAKKGRQRGSGRERENKKVGERCFENWAKLGECDSDNK